MKKTTMKKEKFYLFRVRLNNDGYDRNGQYFGVGLPLYYFASVKDTGYYIGDNGYIRACSREQAKDMVATAIPNATFFN
jgi:hypothetical protein